jgi:L-ascorbate metabolism protein UlaG (beta-lactamase superfamily)
MLVNGKYQKTEIKGVKIHSVPAFNKSHGKDCCVGYIITIDGIKIYASGDTSYTDYMQAKLSQEEIDYALLPIDGIFNMDVKEAEKCAKIINSRHTIPIHTSPVNTPSRIENTGVSVAFDLEKAESLDVEGRIIMRPTEEIELFGK